MLIACAEGLHLRRRHQAGMIVLVAGERQAEALDRVGDEAGRPVVVDAPWKASSSDAQIVAGEVGHQPRQLVVASAARSALITGPDRRSRRAAACASAAPPWNTSAE